MAIDNSLLIPRYKGRDPRLAEYLVIRARGAA